MPWITTRRTIPAPAMTAPTYLAVDRGRLLATIPAAPVDAICARLARSPWKLLATLAPRLAPHAAGALAMSGLGLAAAAPAWAALALPALAGAGLALTDPRVRSPRLALVAAILARDNPLLRGRNVRLVRGS